MTVSPEIDTLARTLYGEARGEGERGMEAVACVVMNRVKAPGWWGNDIVSVCKKPFQFSCWLTADPNYKKIIAVTTDDMAFRVALEVAGEAAGGTLADITGGATHYFSDDISAPKWAGALEFCCQIGKHSFYKERSQG